MTDYRVRAAVYVAKHGGAVFFPSGKDHGSRKRGRPTVPPPPYRAPKEQTWTVASLPLEKQMAKELRLEYGDKIVIAIEPVEKPAPEARLVQTSMADLGNWPSGFPRRRWMESK